MSAQSYVIPQNLPGSFTLRHSIHGSGQAKWSPDGSKLAFVNGRNLELWNMQTTSSLPLGKIGYDDNIGSFDWYNERILTVSFSDGIKFIDAQTTQHITSFTNGWVANVTEMSWSPQKILATVAGPMVCFWTWDKISSHYSNFIHLPPILEIPHLIRWSPDGQTLAIAINNTIELWSLDTKRIQIFTGHSEKVTSLVWQPFSTRNLLASGSRDRTIRIWSSQEEPYVLEGHTSSIVSLSFSHDGRLLASEADNHVIHIRRADTWEHLETFLTTDYDRSTLPDWLISKINDSLVLFHPKIPSLAIRAATRDSQISKTYIMDIENETFLRAKKFRSVNYRSAKAVLIGESGAGKSGLSLVLTDRPFEPTFSTHNRNIMLFDKKEVESDDQVKELREIQLWDLAGQPDYRLIHQLHLNEVTVALLVFDASSETEMFASIRYWERALRMAQHTNSQKVHLIKKFLIAARLDRGGYNVTMDQIRTLAEELGCSGFFGTSAREGWLIPELKKAILDAIDWTSLPKVVSNDLFLHIQTFLKGEWSSQLLLTEQTLYYAFLQSKNAPPESDELRAQFETCLKHVAASGLIRQFGFGNLVLLHPELLDSYASALLITVKKEASGLGYIVEERVRQGDFFVPEEGRLKAQEEEKLLLIAMIEEMLRQELVFREEGNLIFPSLFSLESTDLSDPKGQAVAISFEGSIFTIYTRLVVRLLRSEIFKKQELWKNALTCTTAQGGTYGIFLQKKTEECAELILFFDQTASQDMRFHFEEFIYDYMQMHALTDSVRRKYMFVCSDCCAPLNDQQVTLRRQRGFNWLTCPVCDTRVSLLSRDEQLITLPTSRVEEMYFAANKQRDREAAELLLEGKRATQDFDVFLCYNQSDLAEVEKIGELLKIQGILPWIDVWNAQPGRIWQDCLEEQMANIRSAAVFVGKSGLGPWDHMQVKVLLQEFTNRKCPVIPVILTDAPLEAQLQLPSFLRIINWIDFRKEDPDPLERLMWGITGKHISRVDEQAISTTS